MNQKRKAVLLIINNPRLRLDTAKALETDALVEAATSVNDVIGEIGFQDYSLAVLDMSDPELDGLAIVSVLVTSKPDLPIVILLDERDLLGWKQYVEQGMAIMQPVSPELLATTVRIALNSERDALTLEKFLFHQENNDNQTKSKPALSERQQFSEELLRFMQNVARLQQKGLWFAHQAVEKDQLTPEDVAEIQNFNQRLEIFNREE